MPVTLRQPTPSDIEPCSRIIYAAFQQIASQHGFTPDFPNLEVVMGMAQMLIGDPTIFGVVAEQDGRIIGSNFLSEADPIRGVCPISVDPAYQGRGVGRMLMQSVLERGKGAKGIRLAQDAFNCVSLSLYASLGFQVKEPLVMLNGRPKTTFLPSGYTVRPFEMADLDECLALHRRVHGVDRAQELRHASEFSAPWVALRGGRITAYASALHFWAFAHGVAKTPQDFQALLIGFAAIRPEPLWFLLPSRQTASFHWCLHEGLRVQKPMNLMTLGFYQEPAACWFPSVMY